MSAFWAGADPTHILRQKVCFRQKVCPRKRAFHKMNSRLPGVGKTGQRAGNQTFTTTPYVVNCIRYYYTHTFPENQLFLKHRAIAGLERLP